MKLMTLLALFPFGYTVVTRMGGMRDLVYLVATQWIPGIWLVHRLGNVTLAEAIYLYALGYFAFIAVYELGYFLNDTWDAQRTSGSRKRFPFPIGTAYTAVFLLVRVALWFAISSYFALLTSPHWILCYVVLCVAVVIHNLLDKGHYRIASFVQLAHLRFILPVIFSVNPKDFLLLFFISSIFYVHFRSLSYLDGKSLLLMPDRKRADFGIVQIIVLAPIVLLVYMLLPNIVLLELLGWFAALYGGVFLMNRGHE